MGAILAIKIAEYVRTGRKTLQLRKQNKKYKHNISKNYNINGTNQNITLCFSRGGNCLDVIQSELEKAKHSIHFMLFYGSSHSKINLTDKY